MTSVLLASLPLSGCTKPESRDKQPNSTADIAASPARAVLTGDQLTRILEMHDSYLTLLSARDAAVYGEVDVAREQLTELATQPMPEGISSIYAPEVLELHIRAGQGARAERPEGVTLGIAHTAQSCGSCHTATGQSPQLAGQMDPPSSDTPAELMQRHAWAAQQLWDGLIIPSDERWQQGANVLASSKLEPSTLFHDEYLADVGAERVHGLQEATKSVAHAASWEDRAEAYGDLLNSCATCHSR